jgi:hypothetical protein
MATENEEIFERIRGISCSSCAVQRILGSTVPVGQLREAIGLALIMRPELKAEWALAARTAELDQLLSSNDKKRASESARR